MPRDFLMSWEPRTRRWQKMYRGRRLCVSCRQLGAPETKEGSYRAANAWFEARRAEIDGQLPAPDFAALFDDALRTPRLRAEMIAWARASGEDVLLAAFEGRLRKDDDGMPIPYDPAVDGPSGPSPTDRSVGHHAALWLESQGRRSRAGELSPAECANRKFYLGHFTSWAGPAADVGSIDEARWHAFHGHLLEKIGDGTWSRSYAEKIARTARQLVEHLAGLRLIEEPRNLRDRSMRINVPVRAVAVIPAGEARRLAESAPGQPRLHLMLMLNCGMTQQDISDLHPSEFDPAAGTITRKRSKTARHEGVPTVTYRLWPETLELLRLHRSGDLGRLLLTRGGRPWVDKDGKIADSIRTNFQRLAKRLGSDATLKAFRKLGATLLESHPVYGRLATLYLGHSPRSIKDRHYVQAPQALLDESLE